MQAYAECLQDLRLESCCEHPQSQTLLKIRPNTSGGNTEASSSCIREPALLKAVVITSTWDWILRIKQIQPEQVGNKKHLALLSSQAAIGSDQLTGGERLRHRAAFSHLQSKDQNPGVSNPHPRLSMLRWGSCFQLVMQKKNIRTCLNQGTTFI